MKKRPHILFVDDEPKVISSIRRTLRSREKNWDVSFAESGQKALEIIDTVNVDVLISDIQMPGMSGQELFDKVHDISPSTVRIVLSGTMEVGNVVETMHNAHRYLTKPCTAEALIQEIREALVVHEDVQSSNVQDIAAHIDHLPVLPEVYRKIEEELSEESPSMQRVADIITEDPSLVASVLKLTNSPFFGLSHNITSIFQAINLLGLQTIKALILSQHLFWGEKNRKNPPFSVQLLWEHSFRVGNMARHIAAGETSDRNLIALCHIAGILHDIGKLTLANAFPKEYEKVLEQVDAGVSIHLAEKEVLGADHAEIGMYIMDLWGIDCGITMGIGMHHAVNSSSVTIPLILATADHLDHLWIVFNQQYTGTKMPEPLLNEIQNNGTLERWKAYILENWPEITEITGFREEIET